MTRVTIRVDRVDDRLPALVDVLAAHLLDALERIAALEARGTAVQDVRAPDSELDTPAMIEAKIAIAKCAWRRTERREPVRL